MEPRAQGPQCDDRSYAGISRSHPARQSLEGIRLDYDGSPRARFRTEVGIIVRLAGPKAQRRFSPRSWRAHHGAGDHEKAADLVLNLNGSDEAETPISSGYRS
jgi:hypothetical protein